MISIRSIAALTALVVLSLATGCRTVPRPGALALRQGDEIIVAGQLFHTGTPIVTWMDPGGYDAYRVERRFSPFDESSWEATQTKTKNIKSPNRYGLRRDGLTDEEVEKVRGGGWSLAQLQNVVDQFVLHFDVCGTSRQCFKVLQDGRGLSVHFMLDVDGTIYQTLDLKERAWHATTSNTRSVGIEIANIGAYSLKDTNTLAEWYQPDADGRIRNVIPKRFGETGIRTPNFVSRPARNEPIIGRVQGGQLKQYDFTPEQYAALIKLTATLCQVFPKMKCDYPRDAKGQLILKKLPDEDLAKYQGVMGHYHVQTNKTDPGPAFQFDYVIDNARKLIPSTDAANTHGRMQSQ